MATQKNRVKPTAYPFLPFHLTRSAQLISSLVVAGIISYFLYELAHNGYRLPWTFMLLLVASLLTIIALGATIFLHIYHGLNPSVNVVVNASLAVAWTVSFAMLARWCSRTVSQVCDMSSWDSDTGVSICRQYKALFSFALLGLLVTLLAVGLDVKVLKGARRRGVFQPVAGLTREDKFVNTGPQELDANPNPVAARASQMRGGQGYAVPEEQFDYDEIAYHGAAGQVGRRSIEDRI